MAEPWLRTGQIFVTPKASQGTTTLRLVQLLNLPLTSIVLDKTLLPSHRFKYFLPQKVALRDRKKSAGDVNHSWKHSLKNHYYYYYCYWLWLLLLLLLVVVVPSDKEPLNILPGSIRAPVTTLGSIRFYLRTIPTKQLPGAPGCAHTSRLHFPSPSWAGARGSLRKAGKVALCGLQKLSRSLCELPNHKCFHCGNPQHLPVCF